MTLFTCHALGRKLAPASHEGLQILVVAGDAERFVTRVVGKADEIVGSLAERDHVTLGIVAEHGGCSPPLFRRSKNGGRDLVRRMRHVDCQGHSEGQQSKQGKCKSSLHRYLVL